MPTVPAFARHAAALAALLAVAGSAFASSHREAPTITTSPKVDGTDFSCFAATKTSRPTARAAAAAP